MILDHDSQKAIDYFRDFLLTKPESEQEVILRELHNKFFNTKNTPELASSISEFIRAKLQEEGVARKILGMRPAPIQDIDVAIDPNDPTKLNINVTSLTPLDHINVTIEV